MLLDLPRKSINVPTLHRFHLDFFLLRFQEFDTFTSVKSRHDLRIDLSLHFARTLDTFHEIYENYNI